MANTDSNQYAMEEFRIKHGMYQILAASVAHSLAIHAGINMAFTTILLPQISDLGSSNSSSIDNVTSATFEPDLYVDKDQATWIASIVAMGTPVGAISSGLLMDRLGRRAVMLVTAMSVIGAWAVCAVTSHVSLLYVGRGLAGLAAGLSTVGIVYVSETSHATLRPMLLSLNSVFVSFGVLLTTLLGQLLPWRGVAWSCSGLGVISLLALFLLPESPVWLHSRHHHRIEEVTRSLKWLYPHPSHYEAELAEMRRSAAASKINALIPEEAAKNRERRTTWRPILLLFGLFTLQQLSGGYIVIFYAIQIFKAAGGLEVDAWTSVTVLGVVRFAMALVCAIMSRHVGRRPLLSASAAGMALTLAAGALANLIAPSSTYLVQQVAILLSVLFSSFGMLVIPWTLIGELLATSGRRRGALAGLVISFAYLLMSATVKVFIYIMDMAGVGYMMLGFAVFSVLAVIYVYYFIPETLGKTFGQIQESLGVKNS